ncbi:MAG: hypothetical protein JW795_20035 [Chitinivibrionales bacterium]|nr:hypothetical protein [Chitinivibrionales bacterium]
MSQLHVRPRSINKRQKVRMVVVIKAIAVASILVFLSSFLSINYFVAKMNDAEVKYNLVNVNIRDFSDNIRDYLLRKISFENIDKKYNEICDILNRHRSLINDTIFVQVDSLWKEIERIHNLENQNELLEGEIMLLTDFVINQANSSLHDPSAVIPSAIEASLMKQHRQNAYYYMMSNYRIKSLFLTVKEQSVKKDKFISYMQNILENTEKDISTMSKTPFEKLPRQTKDANEKILLLFNDFAGKSEQIHQTQQRVFESIKRILKSIAAEEQISRVALFSQIRFLVTAVVVILIIALAFITLVYLFFSQVQGHPIPVAESTMHVTATDEQSGVLSTEDIRTFSHLFSYSIDKLQNLIAALGSTTTQLSQTIKLQSQKEESHATQVIESPLPDKPNSTQVMIEKLNASTRQITRDIELLKNVADQTNIFMLNAMVSGHSPSELHMLHPLHSQAKSPANK